MKKTRSTTQPASTQPRPRRRIHDEHFDPYEPVGKLADLTVCGDCGALYREGRWTWSTAPIGSTESICPACKRIADGDPAATLEIAGDFFARHREEIEHLLRHVEAREKRSHPLKRIMAIVEEERGLEIQTTNAKLARSLGRALKRAYGGELDLPATEPGTFTRVRWSRVDAP